MKQTPATASSPTAMQREAFAHQLFPLLFGVFLGLALLKFGNPPIMHKFVTAPADNYEWLLAAWPVEVGYWLLGGLALAGIFTVRRLPQGPRWFMLLPLLWLVWQFCSATQTVDPDLTRVTVKHFTACAVCFYLGFFTLNREGAVTWFLGPVAGAFGLVIAVGIHQHFGGLQQTREYFYTYVYPTLPQVPPEYLKKISSDRIFSTVFYPNALAGAILLLLPPLLAWIWQARERFTVGARSFLCGVMAAGALACLYWSGSKGGWLLTLISGLVVLLHQDFSKRVKLALVAAVLIGGGAGFLWKYADFFQRGATSVVARFDYWEAAWTTAVAKPILGSGPGTFGTVYAAIKRPESEMARLTHNDYLQQASDSGFPGLILFAGFIVGSLCLTYPKVRDHRSTVAFGVWIGLMAWALQALGEFTLYVPSLAWPAFAFMGWLLATPGKPFDKPKGGV